MKKQACPKCGSGNISYKAALNLGQFYVCNDCGWEGNIILEYDENAEEAKKEVKKEKQSASRCAVKDRHKDLDY